MRKLGTLLCAAVAAALLAAGGSAAAPPSFRLTALNSVQFPDRAFVLSSTSGKPLSVSRVNITPAAARSERNMRCTPADSATSAWAKP